MKNLLLPVLIFASLSLASCASNITPPSVQKGILDLTGEGDSILWNFNKDGAVDLDGEWEFYWNELLTPDSFSLSNEGLIEAEYITVPHEWNKTYLRGSLLSNEGYATYRLTVKFDGPDDLYGIHIPGIYSSFRIWMNGKEYTGRGTVADSAENYSLYISPENYYVFSENGEIEIVIQVANYELNHSGIIGSLSLGCERLIKIKEILNFGFLFLVIGSLIIMALYHITLFVLRTKEPGALLFGIFCLMMVYNILFLGDLLFIRVDSTLSWTVLYRFYVIFTFLSLAVFSHYIYFLFPQDFSIFTSGIIDLICLISLFISFFAKLPVLFIFNRIFGLVLTISTIYILITLIKSIKLKRQGAIYSFAGLIFLFIFILIDLIFWRNLINSVNLTSFGVYLFIISQAVLLSTRFAKTTLQTEGLTEELEKQNIILNDFADHLEQKVEERTEELKKMQGQIIIQEKVASLGKLTAGIAHEIKNPLNFVNNFADISVGLIDDINTDLKELCKDIKSDKKEYLFEDFEDLKLNVKKINEHGKRADDIVKAMLLHSREKTGEKQMVNIHKLLEEYLNLSYHGMRAEDSSFNITYIKDYDNTIPETELFARDMGRVFLNLMNNAYYATQEKKKLNYPEYSPTLWVTTKNKNHQIEIIIKDNGIGIPKSALDKIFNPFFTTKPAGKGTGLGLSLSHDIVIKEHGGELEVNTQKNEFTEFIIRLPIK